MVIKENLYNEFLNFSNDALNPIIAETISTIEGNSKYKYGNKKDKISVLNYLKKDFAGNGYFNSSRVKGVIYINKSFKIIKEEFLEVIAECGVNLENIENGLFSNKFDLNKPPAYKSYNQAIFILTYCLRLQIIKEFQDRIESNTETINYLNSNPDYINLNPSLPSQSDHPIFRDKPSEEFFDYLFKEWLNNTSKNQPLNEISFIFRSLWNDKDFEFYDPEYHTKDIRQIDFAIFWNKKYSPLHYKNYELKIKPKGVISFKKLGHGTPKKTLSKLEDKYKELKNAFKSIPTH